MTFVPSIQQTLSAKSSKWQSSTALSEKSQSIISLFDLGTQKQQMPSAIFDLDWSQYQVLMRVGNVDARRFYEIESASQQWTVKQLQRQVGSSLYER